MATDFINNIVVSFICVILTVSLFASYFFKRINSVELILLSYTSQSFYLAFITKTISSFFFVTLYFTFYYIIQLKRGRVKIHLPTLLIIVLPVISSIIAFFLILLGYEIFDGENPSAFRVIFNCIFFYLKYFCPLIFLGLSIHQESRHLSVEQINNTLKRVAIISCYIALLQLVLTNITDNLLLLRIFGIRYEYLDYATGGQESGFSRICALFLEPKALAFYLGLCIPLFYNSSEFFKLALVLIVGLLTASQTFILGIILWGVIFLFYKRLHSVRANILISLITLAAVFYQISIAKVFFFNFYQENSNNTVVSLILARAIDRYDIEGAIESNEVAGIPLQRDMELPVYKFFMTKPLLYLSGYGLKNGGYIPQKYYPEYSQERRTVGSLTYSLNMKWYYFICEFGLVIFFIWFLFFTRKIKGLGPFEKKYYAFLWVYLFFIDLEPFLIIFYSAYTGRSYWQKNDKTIKND